MSVDTRLACVLLAAVATAACGSREGRELCEAIGKDDVAAVERLLALGSDPNERVMCRRQLRTPWKEAVFQLMVPNDEREAIALAILEAGGDPNLLWAFDGESGVSVFALEVVVRGGSVRLVEALIDAGADVAGRSGGQALIAAARFGQRDILRILVDAGAPVNHKDREDATPLGAAIEAADREAIQYLESVGAREW